jgi:hypothetical protein
LKIVVIKVAVSNFFFKLKNNNNKNKKLAKKNLQFDNLSVLKKF